MRKIISSCCCFGQARTKANGKGLSFRIEEVHVKMEECPIKRQDGERPEYEEATCIHRGFRGLLVEPCQFYGGTRKNNKGVQTQYIVTCEAPDAGLVKMERGELDSRPFTKEEAKVHAEIVDSMSTVVEDNVFDLGGELDA